MSPSLGRLAQALLDLGHNSSGNLLRRGVAAQIGREDARLAHILDNLHQLLRGLPLAEPLQHLRGGPEGGDGVGDALSGDVKGRTVDGLEHGRVLARGVQVACRGNANGASQSGSQVGQNISVLEKITLVKEDTRIKSYLFTALKVYLQGW